MRRKFNWGNLVVLLIMVTSALIICNDFLVMFVSIIKNTTATLTFFGFVFDICCLVILETTYDYLFGE